MTLDTYTRAMMADFCMREGARHGGILNMLAVAHVLRNRVFSGWGDWLEVVQTAPAKRGTIYPESALDLRTANARAFLNRLEDVYTSEQSEDMTGGALFYCEPQMRIEEWFKETVFGSDDHPRTAHVGPVWFFK
jgi:hypothetical protein